MNRVVLGVVVLAAVLWLRSIADPCASPITYRLGDIDERFGLTHKHILAALRRAEAAWEDPAGRDLFRYEETGEVAINFVYDARQATAQQNFRRKTDIARASSSADEFKQRHDAVTADYERARREYAVAESDHDARVVQHNREVAQLDARGGASRSQLDSLQMRAAELESSAAALEKKRLAVNALADRANSLSRRFNELAVEVRENVDAYNQGAGHEFKQGRYVESGGKQHIDVFEFVGANDLVHLLAHELGHALGLGHDGDEDSIMYGLNSTEAVTLTAGDLDALRRKCRL